MLSSNIFMHELFLIRLKDFSHVNNIGSNGSFSHFIFISEQYILGFGKLQNNCVKSTGFDTYLLDIFRVFPSKL
jgi:hypothetical protein